MNLIITNTESQPILVWVWKKRFKKSIISEIWFRIEKIQVERIMMKKKLQEKKEVEKKLQEKKEVEKNNNFYWIFQLAISLWLPIIMRMKTFWIHKVTCILFLGVACLMTWTPSHGLWLWLVDCKLSTDFIGWKTFLFHGVNPYFFRFSVDNHVTNR